MRRSVFQFPPICSGLLFLLFAALLTGCASHIPVRYYTLKPVQGVETLTASHSIGIQPVIMPVWLEENKISWNNGDVNLVILEQDRWAGPLSKVINQTMLRNFSRFYPDALVSLGPWVRSATPERIVAVRIMALERANNTLSTEIAITISNQKREVLTNSFRIYQQPLAENSSASKFADTLGTILGMMNQDIALSLEKLTDL